MKKKTSAEEDLEALESWLYETTKEVEGNKILIVGYITKESASRVVNRLKQIENDSSFSEICIVLTSAGGDVRAAFSICEAMKKCKKPIEVRSELAWSAAVPILVNGTKGKRFVYKRSSVMIHRGRVVSSSPDNGFIRRFIAKFLNRCIDMLDDSLLAIRTGQPFTKVHRDAQRETYFSAQEAVKYGFADGVLSNDAME